jgi:hypothetical protein
MRLSPLRSAARFFRSHSMGKTPQRKTIVFTNPLLSIGDSVGGALFPAAIPLPVVS